MSYKLESSSSNNISLDSEDFKVNEETTTKPMKQLVFISF